MKLAKHRSLTALGALLALSVAAPAAHAKRPDVPAPPDHPGHANGGGNSHANGGTRGGDHGPAGANDPAATDPAATDPAATDACGYGEPRQLFLQWNDRKRYVLTENGSLEQGDTGWTLADGASVVEGNEPFLVNDPADHQSLSLPAGATATSPATCVTAGQPVFRFFARTTGDRSSRLRVDVLYLDGKGKKRARRAGKLHGGEEWRPTKKLAVALGRAKKGRGRITTANIAFRFTPVGEGDWQIDDLSLDPRARR